MRISDWSSDLCASDLEVLGRRDAALGRRCAKGIEDLPRQALRLDAPLAAAAVAFVAALVVVLRALEVGQDLVPAPAGVAELAPEIDSDEALAVAAGDIGTKIGRAHV